MNKLIILNGPSGAGKTTVAKILWRKMERTALIDLDQVKWLISDYQSDDHDLGLSGSIGLNMTEGFLGGGLNVIVEKAFCKNEYMKPYLDLAEKLGIPYYIFNIEASLETLVTRAKDRSLKEGRRFNEEKTARIYAEYLDNKIETKTFDSENNTSEEIANMLFDLIQ